MGGCPGFRWVVLALGTLGPTLMISNILTLNFSIICILPNNSTNASEELPGPKLWLSLGERSAVLSAFAWASLAGIAPFLWAMRRLGLRLAFVLTGAVSALATLATPLAVEHGGLPALLVCRVLTGFAYSSVFPTMGGVAAAWAPMAETGLWMGFLASCTQLSPIFTNSIAGELCESSWGWPAIYYVHGICSIVFLFFWIVLYRNTPHGHFALTDSELTTIVKGKAKGKVQRPVPWLSIGKSLPVWAIIAATFGNMCGVQFLIYYTPTYLKSVLNFDVKSSGFLSALPSLLMFVWKMIIGALSEFLKPPRVGWLRPSLSVKLFNSSALFGMAIGYFLLCIPDLSSGWAYALLTLTMTVLGGHSAGFFKSVMLVGRDFGPVIMSFVQLTTCIVLLGVPFLQAALVPGGLVSEWRVAFLVMGVVLVVSNVAFVALGSGEAQPWALSAQDAPSTEPKEPKTAEDAH